MYEKSNKKYIYMNINQNNQLIKQRVLLCIKNLY